MRRSLLVLLMLQALACGRTTTAPTPVPASSSAPTPSTTSVLTGQVTDLKTSAPIPGARIIFSQPPSRSTTTDTSGQYSLAGLPAPPSGGALVWATAADYEADVRYYRGPSQNFGLYPIVRIMAGDSTVVTVKPDDTLCSNDIDSPGWGGDVVCRIVRIVPRDGILTVEALAIGTQTRPRLVVQVVDGNRSLLERLGNPISIPVSAGTEVMAFIEMEVGSTTSQSSTLTTSMELDVPR